MTISGDLDIEQQHQTANAVDTFGSLDPFNYAEHVNAAGLLITNYDGLSEQKASKSGKQLKQSFSSLQLRYNVLFRMGSSLDVDCQGCGSATITLGAFNAELWTLAIQKPDASYKPPTQGDGRKVDSGLNPDFHNQKAASTWIFSLSLVSSQIHSLSHRTELQSAHLVTVRLKPLVLISFAPCFNPFDPKIFVIILRLSFSKMGDGSDRENFWYKGSTLKYATTNNISDLVERVITQPINAC
ncbi:uncharacterized protein P174DRAFT_432102 [Aspergillus novofumigatus IBT 16806]|uniref:Uncharacterized protein n=1 Tax=Aspergillus novofumigatus (strain IBT 16806) TaxID=1392255 RepID=A0A2I1C529_ASPN1|nr:uncharacterized protein P174DRAFT_432102 [Aspergillus novofumigatus IBT 16806]PKX92717.1 hypothetical protein P174DRAFT_432102 [Aspergillus novofumigatus IBT 16806]